MKKTALLPLVAMLVYSGCARQSMQTSDRPLEVPLAKPAQIQTDQVAPPQKNSNRPEASNTTATGRDETLKKPEGSGSTPITATLTTLEKIYFDFDSSNLSATARKSLAENYQILHKNPAIKLRIEGNCDERGSDEYNLALGERRALAAARYLTTFGIAAERISTISLGEEKPADPGHDESAWAKNRRDEFIIIGR